MDAVDGATNTRIIDQTKLKASFHVNKDVLLSYYICFSLYVFFICDAIDAYIFYVTHQFARLSIIPRTVFEFSILCFFVLEKRTNKRAGILLVCILILINVFFLGFGSFVSRNTNANILQNIILLNKMFFFFICVSFLQYLKDTKTEFDLKMVFRTYETLILINGTAMIAGLIFNIHFLSSYGALINGSHEASRFGYKGFIEAINEATVFWVIALFYGLYLYKIERRKMHFLISIFCCIILGSKGGLFFCLFILFLFYFLQHKRTGLVLFLSLIAISPFLFKMLLHFYETLPIFGYFRYRQSVGVDVFSILVSGRDTFILTRFLTNILEKWTLINWFFGGQDITASLIEMDLFDTFLFLGFVGTIIYFAMYFLTFSELRRPLKRLFIVSYFLLAIFNGHTFWSGVNAMYLAIFITKASQQPQAYFPQRT
jgi:hypothetical protein